MSRKKSIRVNAMLFLVVLVVFSGCGADFFLDTGSDEEGLSGRFVKMQFTRSDRYSTNQNGLSRNCNQ